jgi:hypothetical protein
VERAGDQRVVEGTGIDPQVRDLDQIGRVEHQRAQRLDGS